MSRAKSPDHLALGRAIRELRRERGATAEALADEMGVNPRWLTACERGEMNITWGSLLKVAGALDVAMSEVVARYETLRDAPPPAD